MLMRSGHLHVGLFVNLTFGMLCDGGSLWSSYSLVSKFSVNVWLVKYEEIYVFRSLTHDGNIANIACSLIKKVGCNVACSLMTS